VAVTTAAGQESLEVEAVGRQARRHQGRHERSWTGDHLHW
jgi:hypothetical protein